MTTGASSSFTGKHVAVTGAAGGLGGAVVDALLDAGATVHALVRSRGKLREHERLIVVPGVDLTNEEAVARAYAALPDPLWASVHLAGGFGAAAAVDTSLALLQEQWQMNAVTAFLCCREAIKRMQAAGGHGRLVNVSSRAATLPMPHAVAYAAAKAAVNAMTQTLAHELRATDILVNAVAPSVIDTPANRAAMPQADIARWPSAASIASVILWLASPDNRVGSGAVLPVYGGA